jgi:hypothetical protein
MDENMNHEIFLNKRTDKIYVSKSIPVTALVPSDLDVMNEVDRNFRIISQVIDVKEDHQFVKRGKELQLRITSGGRQEILAKFYEDTRGVFSLQIQKWTTISGMPHNTYFSFVGDEISKLYKFVKGIAHTHLNDSASKKIDEVVYHNATENRDNAINAVLQHPEIINEVLKNDVTKSDIIALGYRKAQIKIFKRLLEDDQYFQEYKSQYNCRGDEAVWQSFFEKNTWVLGYGLSYIFNTPLDGKKLEQVVSGFDAFSSGKRVDAFLKTRGVINSLCFTEIKTHNTPLLKKSKDPYRSECWAASDELSGGIAQIQKTVQKSIRNIETKTEIKDSQGFLTREQVFLYKPKSYLLIGSLKQFKNEVGVNEDQFSSFELFRQSVSSPEIITFDELYERAKYIIASTDLEE